MMGRTALNHVDDVIITNCSVYINGDGGWQPIATAPDKQILLVFYAQYGEQRIAWQGSMGKWRDYQGNMQTPTHWMPLPAPPVDRER